MGRESPHLPLARPIFTPVMTPFYPQVSYYHHPGVPRSLYEHYYRSYQRYEAGLAYTNGSSMTPGYAHPRYPFAFRYPSPMPFAYYSRSNSRMVQRDEGEELPLESRTNSGNASNTVDSQE